MTGGEQDNNLTLWQYLIDSGTMDVAQPDVCYVGGVDRFLRVARMARDAGMPVTPHAANLSLVTIFTLHLMGALENAGPMWSSPSRGPTSIPGSTVSTTSRRSPGTEGSRFRAAQGGGSPSAQNGWRSQSIRLARSDSLPPDTARIGKRASGEKRGSTVV